jgi:hypothetical protein
MGNAVRYIYAWVRVLIIYVAGRRKDRRRGIGDYIVFTALVFLMEFRIRTRSRRLYSSYHFGVQAVVRQRLFLVPLV